MFYAPPTIMQFAFSSCSFCNFCVCHVDSYQRINLACAVGEFKRECIYVYVIKTNSKRTTFNKFRRCNRFPLSKSIHSLSATTETPSTKIWLPEWQKSKSKVVLSRTMVSLPILRLQFSCERPLSAGFISLSRCAALKSFEHIIHGAHNFLIKQNLRVKDN